MRSRIKPAYVWEAPDPASDLPCPWVISGCLWGRDRPGALARWQVGTRESCQGEIPSLPNRAILSVHLPRFLPPACMAAGRALLGTPLLSGLAAFLSRQSFANLSHPVPEPQGQELGLCHHPLHTACRSQGSAALVLEH